MADRGSGGCLYFLIEYWMDGTDCMGTRDAGKDY